MHAEKWIALPEGTKVKMTCDYSGFTKWDIITRVHCWSDSNRSVRFETEDLYWYFPDDVWELIEEEPRLPKQGDRVHVKGEYWPDFSDDVCTFVCFYKNQVLVEKNNRFAPYSEWRFPPQEEVTLSDGKTYLVEERGEEKILKLKK